MEKYSSRLEYQSLQRDESARLYHDYAILFRQDQSNVWVRMCRLLNLVTLVFQWCWVLYSITIIGGMFLLMSLLPNSIASFWCILYQWESKVAQNHMFRAWGYLQSAGVLALTAFSLYILESETYLSLFGGAFFFLVGISASVVSLSFILCLIVDHPDDQILVSPVYSGYPVKAVGNFNVPTAPNFLV